jgi:adenylate cyclase
LKAYTKYRINSIINLGIGGILLSILSRVIDGDSVFQIDTIVHGITIGTLVGIFELFIFKSKFRKLNFLSHIFLKSIILTIVIYVLGVCLFFIDFLFGEIPSFTAYIEVILNPNMFWGTLITLLYVSILLFFYRLDLMLGPGNLMAYIKGTFHKPKEELRIFMFLDLKDSTKIGEELSKNDYFSFLNDYFHFMTKPILEKEARIYQYVGDEIVLTWNFKNGIKNNNCIEIFFRITDMIEQHSLYFNKKYGVIPEFKAGIHFGSVIRAQIGDLKKEIIFNGDVLNTTARIQSMCNELGKKLLISEELFNHLEIKPNKSSDLGFISLKGKENKLKLFSIEVN